MDNEIKDEFTRILLEVEVSPKGQGDFESEYYEITGERPEVGEYYQIQPDKWGLECRIYFDAPYHLCDRLRDLGYHVEERDSGYRSDYEFRINNNELFWRLATEGLLLGEN